MPSDERERYLCPEGHELAGTLELQHGQANGKLYVGADGKPEEEFEGYTEWFDSQDTVYRDNQAMWICEEGAEYPQDKLITATEFAIQDMRKIGFIVKANG